MKNREKYIDEIIKAAVNGTCCNFMLDKVMSNFIDSSVNANNLCEDGKCTECSMLFALWLDEEYKEPPKPEVDWNKVPVDTLVRVLCRHCDLLSPLYEHYKRDGCALCPNAPKREREQWFKEYPEAVPILKELQDKVRAEKPEQTPLRNHEWFL